MKRLPKVLDNSKIINLYTQGLTMRDLSERFNTSRRDINRIIHEEERKTGNNISRGTKLGRI
jgi:acetyl-CoA acetyltransferase